MIEYLCISVFFLFSDLKDKMPRCHICYKNHPLKYCPFFKRMTPEKRRVALIANNMCLNCLAHTHTRRECESENRCSICHLKHHSFIHHDEDWGYTSSVDHTDYLQQEELSSSDTDDTISLPEVIPLPNAPALPQALVTPLVRVLFEHEMGREWMTLMIRPEVKHSLLNIFSVFRIPFLWPDMDKNDQYRATFMIKGKTSHFQWTFRLVDDLGVPPPTPPNDPRLRAHFNHLQPLAHDNFHTETTIDGYIGSKSWNTIKRQQTIAAPCTPLAQATEFGWVISGAWYGCNCTTHEGQEIQHS